MMEEQDSVYGVFREVGTGYLLVGSGNGGAA
jgi:hypothetical protein